MSLVATILGVLFISQLVECTQTNPNDFCEHSDTSDPVVLNETSKLCAERDVYTPPELACTFPTTSVRAFYTGQINASVTNAKITTKQGGNLMGYANAVYYKRFSFDLSLNVYSCSLFAYQPPQSWSVGFVPFRKSNPKKKNRRTYITFDNPIDCYHWWTDPLNGVCKTLKRIKDQMNRDGGNYVLPVDCRLTEVARNEHTRYMTTFHGNNIGSNHHNKYLHANIYLYTVATLSRTEDGTGSKLQSKKDQHNSISVTNRDDLLRGYMIHSIGVYAFRPLGSQELCTHNKDRTLELTITRFVKNEIPTYSFTSRRPHLYGYYQYSDFNISESDFKKLKTNSNQCYSSNTGSRIVSREHGDVIVAVDVTRFPRSDQVSCPQSKLPPHQPNY
ncbi:hypothetical protein ElyMa_001471800 [Elysia marginata]|uniref:Uncharacterized protein n=1 Tax=Elysia marginata TaxID=1093978 RepID=A0AAV4J362_9GAST|nr:hypothetical protein ElyMa_001471800 [Elysia marginata]